MALIGEMQYLTIGGNTYSIPTSGGSTVSVTRTLTSGTKTATISVDGTSYDLYAPTPNAGTITSVKTTAGAHTTIDVSSGTASFNIPTKTSHLTNDSGYVTTDEKLKTTVAFNGTYFPLFGAATSTAETKYYNGNFRYSKTTSIDSLQLGQVSSSSTSKGRLTLCSGPYYTYLDPPLYSTISANQTYTLPASSGTIALTSDIPTKTSDLTNDSGFITNSGLNNYLEKSYTGSNQTGSIGWYTDDNNNNNIYLLTQVDNTNESTSSYIGLESGSVGLSTTYNENEDSFTGEITVEGKRVDIGFSNGSGVGDTLYYFTIDEYNGYNFRSINNHDYYNIYMPQNKSGTVALTSDIPKVYSSTNTGGYLTMATLPIYDGTVV